MVSESSPNLSLSLSRNRNPSLNLVKKTSLRAVTMKSLKSVRNLRSLRPNVQESKSNSRKNMNCLSQNKRRPFSYVTYIEERDNWGRGGGKLNRYRASFSIDIRILFLIFLFLNKAS